MQPELPIKLILGSRKSAPDIAAPQSDQGVSSDLIYKAHHNHEKHPPKNTPNKVAYIGNFESKRPKTSSLYDYHFTHWAAANAPAHGLITRDVIETPRATKSRRRNGLSISP